MDGRPRPPGVLCPVPSSVRSPACQAPSGHPLCPTRRWAADTRRIPLPVPQRRPMDGRPRGRSRPGSPPHLGLATDRATHACLHPFQTKQKRHNRNGAFAEEGRSFCAFKQRAQVPPIKACTAILAENTPSMNVSSLYHSIRRGNGDPRRVANPSCPFWCGR